MVKLINQFHNINLAKSSLHTVQFKEQTFGMGDPVETMANDIGTYLSLFVKVSEKNFLPNLIFLINC